MKPWLVVGLLLLTVTLAHASRGLLSWHYPRAYSPQPSSFTITYTHSSTPTTGLQQMTASPSAPGACGTVTAADDDTYCALWPDCPAAGSVLLFWIQAVYPDGVVSGPSNTLLCQFTAAQPCVCLDPGEEPPAPPATVPTPPPPAPPDALTSILSALPSAAPA